MRYAKFSLIFGIVGLITNIMFLTYDGAPLGVGFGILGIGCAIAARETDEEGSFPRGAKPGLIISIVALAFGLLFFLVQMLGMNVLSDPKMSKEVIKQMEDMIKVLPEGQRAQFEEALRQFK